MSTTPDERLYPELPELAKEEAAKMIREFTKRITSIASETIETAYVNWMPHIESDSWSNFRSSIINGISDYNSLTSEQDKQAIRKAILKHHRDEIIDDLDQDNLIEIQRLKDQMQRMAQAWGH